MNLAAAATVAGAAVLVPILFEALKRALGLTPAAIDRFGPVMSIALGLVVTVPSALYVGADPGAAILSGILAGAAACGLYDVAKATGPKAAGA